MVAEWRQIRAKLADWRVWAVTCLLISWPAIGIFTHSNFVLESVTPLVYVYLLVLDTTVREFPAFHPFWVGFALFCFSISTVLVAVFDWVYSMEFIETIRTKVATKLN